MLRAVKTEAAISPTADIFIQDDSVARNSLIFRSQVTPTSDEAAVYPLRVIYSLRYFNAESYFFD